MTPTQFALLGSLVGNDGCLVLAPEEVESILLLAPKRPSPSPLTL